VGGHEVTGPRCHLFASVLPPVEITQLLPPHMHSCRSRRSPPKCNFPKFLRVDPAFANLDPFSLSSPLAPSSLHNPQPSSHALFDAGLFGCQFVHFPVAQDSAPPPLFVAFLFFFFFPPLLLSINVCRGPRTPPPLPLAFFPPSPQNFRTEPTVTKPSRYTIKRFWSACLFPPTQVCVVGSVFDFCILFSSSTRSGKSRFRF